MKSQTISVAHGLNPSHRALQQIRSGEYFAFEQLLDRWEPIIKTKARSFSAPGCDTDDFQQVGRFALFRAALTYRPGSAQFHTYANSLIVRAMIDEHREHAEEAQPGNVETATYETVVYDDPLVACELTASITRWRGTLDDRQQQVITLMFFMDMKQTAVAARLRITPARVSQIIRHLRVLAQHHELN